MSAKRILLETSTGKLSLAQGATTLGRSRTCGVRLEDLSASRNHAMLTRDGDRVSLRDLESSNGTFLNGERLEQEVDLAHGDVITIGESELRLAILGAETEAGSETLGSGVDLSTQYVPRQGVVPPSSSEALAVGDALPVGEVLAQSRPGWKSTGVLPMPASTTPPPAPFPLAPPAPPLPTVGRPVARFEPKADGAELLPSIEEIEKQLAAQEQAAKIAPPRAAAARLAPAGFFRRLLAQIIDGVLAFLVGLGVSFVAGGPLDPTGGMVMSLTLLVVGVLLHVGGWVMGGASPGKKLLGLVVCDDKGRQGLSLGKALLRYVGYFVSSLPLCAGYLIALFHPQKKALHDLIAGTVVSRR